MERYFFPSVALAFILLGIWGASDHVWLKFIETGVVIGIYGWIMRIK